MSQQSQQIDSRDKSIKMYINILPLLIIVLLIAGAGYLLFGQDIKLPKREDKLTKIIRIQGFPARVSVDGDREKVRRVITSKKELMDFLAEVDPQKTLKLTDEPDFSKHVVVASSTETLQGTLNSYRIKRIVKDVEDKELTVEQELILPMEECPNKETEEDRVKKSIVVDLIMLNKTTWKIDFDLLKKELPCEEF